MPAPQFDQRVLNHLFPCLFRFRNISRIMDCVGCEKCRLWGKLQTLGIGTAVKILLTDEEELIGNLERNEVIALVNTVGQMAKSVKFAANSRDMEFEQVVMPQMKWPAVVVRGVTARRSSQLWCQLTGWRVVPAGIFDWTCWRVAGRNAATAIRGGEQLLKQRK
jgi:hypothetical protein